MKKNTHKNAKVFYKEIESEYQLSGDELILLGGICENLSVYWIAADLLAGEGLTFTSESGQIKKNPAVEIMKNAWAGFLSGCRLLQICQPGEKLVGGRGIKK